MLVTKRRISFSSSTEGPSHDPYHVEIIRVRINDDVITVRDGSLSGCTLSRNKETILSNVQDDEQMKCLEAMFTEMTNMELSSVQKYHYQWLARNPEIAEMMRVDEMMRRYAM